MNDETWIEELEARQKERHLNGDCPEDCDYCELDKETAKESLGG